MTGRVSAALLLAALAFDPHQLLVTDQRGHVVERICSTSPGVCQQALDAILAGRWAPELRGRQLRCEPAPCFSRRSQCIDRFNC